ncbi:MAG: hypothetical protein M3136_06185, partial [Thermoproteota archaeon]|nr:hypothetical protein [Thermoproteota archaeon]
GLYIVSQLSDSASNVNFNFSFVMTLEVFIPLCVSAPNDQAFKCLFGLTPEIKNHIINRATSSIHWHVQFFVKDA